MDIRQLFKIPEDRLIFNYNQFLNLAESLASQGKTTGSNQSAALTSFTQLNVKRMQRIGKTGRIEPDLVNLLSGDIEKQHWLVITEGWCGDSAQSLPVIQKIASASNGNISLNIILRDQSLELMAQYLTAGTRSIPKLIALDDLGNELFTWGPRPEPAQKMLAAWKQKPSGRSWDDFEKDLHTWYALDKGLTLQREFLGILSSISDPVNQV